MKRVLIWDLPTRLFHWLFAVGVVAAAVIAFVLGDHSPLFPYHAIIGLTLAGMVVLRLVWGFIGTRYARFGSFTFGPRAVFEYTMTALRGGGKRHIGHNPGSAYAIFAMLALLMVLAITGVLMSQGNETFEEVHEVSAYALVGVAAAHVLGVASHTLRHRENISASMIHGRKRAEPQDAIASARPVAAVVFLVITGALCIGLVRNYNPSTQTTVIPFIGTAMQLGEAERNGPGAYGGRDEDDDDHHED
jgi:cytochrome b